MTREPGDLPLPTRRPDQPEAVATFEGPGGVHRDQVMPMKPSPAVQTAPPQPVWTDRAARFYAQGMDRSDYGAQAAAALLAALGRPASLLDLGAGAGHPARGWVPSDSPWFAVEPNRYLRARLGRLSRTSHPALHPLNAVWQELPPLPPVDVAFCANIPGTLEAPEALLGLMRFAATRAVAWIVPAQRGPKRWCLSGALPTSLHGEEERPAVAGVLAALGPKRQPSRSAIFPWSFAARFASPTEAFAHCAAQLDLPPGDPRRAALADHLAQALRPLPEGGFELTAPKLSALLIWNLA
ncbi:MAG: Methyltransferase type 11 [Rubritepida sp.]|nr:Methyltransferase type 11 [Rubritepida sp.]